jgi:hypothetical protein
MTCHCSWSDRSLTTRRCHCCCPLRSRQSGRARLRASWVFYDATGDYVLPFALAAIAEVLAALVLLAGRTEAAGAPRSQLRSFSTERAAQPSHPS